MHTRGQDRAFRFLKNAYDQDRMPSALLFTGGSGVGKTTAAYEIAAALFCEHGAFPRACGECRGCRRVFNHHHPDFTVVMSEADADARGVPFDAPKSRSLSVQIRVEQVRNLAKKLRQHAFEGGYRVCVIRRADRMNDNAANALLKTLEEPGERTLMILTAPHARAVLPTIHSRAIRLSFSPLSDATLRTLLEERQAEDIDTRVRAAEGSMARALAAHARETESQREQLRDLLDAICNGSPAERLDAIEACGRDREAMMTTIDALKTALKTEMRDALERGDAISHQDLRLCDALDDAHFVLRENNAHAQLTLEEVALLRARPGARRASSGR